MSNSIVAKRYALALFQLGKEKNLLDRLEEELRVVKDVFTKTPEVNALLSSPKLTVQRKREILNEAFSTANPYVLHTLMIMVDKHRTLYISEMADHFIELVNEEKGVADAAVYSVRELSKDEQEALSSVFASKVGKKSLRIKNIIDTNLLGGVKLRIGNRIFDGSLRGKLERMERQLLAK